ncbi:MAG TPA: DUF3553 domain-containing protein [Geobacteraceae bacterium]
MLIKGDLVRHETMPSWGIGKIVKVVQGGNLLVRFSEGGERLLHPNYAQLRKIREEVLLYLVVHETCLVRGRPLPKVRYIPVLKPRSLL